MKINFAMVIEVNYKKEYLQQVILKQIVVAYFAINKKPVSMYRPCFMIGYNFQSRSW